MWVWPRQRLGAERRSEDGNWRAAAPRLSGGAERCFPPRVPSGTCAGICSTEYAPAADDASGTQGAVGGLLCRLLDTLIYEVAAVGERSGAAGGGRRGADPTRLRQTCAGSPPLIRAAANPVFGGGAEPECARAGRLTACGRQRRNEAASLCGAAQRQIVCVGP